MVFQLVVNKTAASIATLCLFGGKFISVEHFDVKTGR